MDPNIKQFLVNLLVEAGFSQVAPEEHEKMLDDLYIKLEDQLMLGVIDALSEEKRADFQGRIEADSMSAQEVEQYIRENLPNYQQVFSSVFQNFRMMFLQTARGA